MNEPNYMKIKGKIIMVNIAPLETASNERRLLHVLQD